MCQTVIQPRNENKAVKGYRERMGTEKVVFLFQIEFSQDLPVPSCLDDLMCLFTFAPAPLCSPAEWKWDHGVRLPAPSPETASAWNRIQSPSLSLPYPTCSFPWLPPTVFCLSPRLLHSRQGLFLSSPSGPHLGVYTCFRVAQSTPSWALPAVLPAPSQSSLWEHSVLRGTPASWAFPSASS